MTRARVLDALVAATATFLVALPLTTLFQPATYFQPLVVLLIVIAVTGMAVRAVNASPWVVLMAQFVVGFEALALLHGRGHLWYLLPTPETIIAYNNLLLDAETTIQSFSAPAPSGRGISLAVGIVLGVVGLVVDHLAVTRRAPAAAGLALLTAYLVSAANATGPLHVGYFLAGAAAWLLLLARHGIRGIQHWSTAAPMSGDGRELRDPDGAFRFAAQGRRLAVVALAGAVAVPLALPHLPTRYLLDGLGRSSSGTGLGEGLIALNTDLDVGASLRSQDTTPVFTYRTDDPTPGPLRLEVVTDYWDGRWRPDREEVRTSEDPRILPDPGLSPAVKRERRTIEVSDNRVKPPQLASPVPVTDGDLGDASWGLDSYQNVRVDRRVDEYSIEYLELTYDRQQLAEQRSAGFPQSGPELELDESSAERIRALADRVIPSGASDIEAAVAIQGHLRNTGYEYTPNIPETARDESGRLVSVDPISHFLLTKKGYCVQYATAMVMMARSRGIPARMAIGYLPGTVDDGEWTVRNTNAHAWPELYFSGAGWVRFEPTPASQSGQAPAYSLVPTDTPSATATTATTGATSSPTTSLPRRDNAGDNDTVTVNPTGGEGALDVWGWVTRLSLGGQVALGLALALLALLTMPLGAWVRRRREVVAAADEAARTEARWQALTRQLEDLGVTPPTGSTPRQAGRHIAHEAYLRDDDATALSRVVATLERSRYAPPGADLPDTSADTRRVLRAVAGSRRRGDRLRAWLLPSDGRAFWSGLPGRLARLARGLPSRLTVRRRRP